jgi:hypothetical protein
MFLAVSALVSIIGISAHAETEKPSADLCKAGVNEFYVETSQYTAVLWDCENNGRIDPNTDALLWKPIPVDGHTIRRREDTIEGLLGFNPKTFREHYKTDR